MLFESELNTFLEKKSKKKKIIVIYWPTASWKTALSVEIAKIINSEIISTDSRQIFRKMNIWTAKIEDSEMKWIKHHMIDIIDPDEDYSVWEFKNESEKIIEGLIKENKIPILCWWTGLYIDSLIYDFDIPKIVADWDLRNKLEKEALEFGVDYIYEKLKEIDPENYHKVHKNNLQYVIRAIEVMMISWKSKYEEEVNKIPKYDILFLTPYIEDNREKLYERINLRADIMFENWLLEEVNTLLKEYNKNNFGLKTIWYEETIKYIEGELTLDESKELVKKNSRNYAKRQLTWFRKYKN